MTAAEFKQKWSRCQGQETSACQGHFDDLCRLLGQPTPAAADPSGSDFFCHQKRVVKNAGLFTLESPEAEAQILERLLALNLERAAEEKRAAKVKRPNGCD